MSAITAMPTVLQPRFDAIPQELRSRPHWVVWRAEEREGKLTKIPYCTTDQRASTTDPSTWLTFFDARRLYEAGGFDGIGYVFSGDDPYTGVDLDAGLSEEERTQIVRHFDSYTELSPSGTGVHILVRAKLTGAGGRRRGPVEVYSSGRFFTVTGRIVDGARPTIEDRQAVLDAWVEETFGPDRSSAGPSAPVVWEPAELTPEDEQALEERRSRDPRFDALWQGKWQGDTFGYTSASEADLAMCNTLKTVLGAIPAKIDAAFRQSGLYRDKWDEPRGQRTYGQMTIEKALRPPGTAAADDGHRADGDAPFGERALGDDHIDRLVEILRPFWKDKGADIVKPLAGYFAVQLKGSGDVEAVIRRLTEPDWQANYIGAARDVYRRFRGGTSPVQGFTSLRLLLGEPAAALIEAVVKAAGGKVETLPSREPLDQMFARARTLEDRLSRPLSTPTPLLPHLAWPQTITMLFGPTGIGKSSLLAQIMLVACLGRWPHRHTLGVIADAGLPVPPRPLRVLYIGPEDSREMFEDARLPLPVVTPFAEVSRRFVYFNERVIVAGENERLREFIAWLKTRDDPFDIVVFDTVSRAHLGLDENKNSDMARVMAAFDAIRLETNASVFFTHHMNKFGARSIRHDTTVRRDPTQARGASVFADQSHVVVSLTKGKDKDTLVLTWTKSNYAPLRSPLGFKRDSSGMFIPIQADSQVWTVRETLQTMGGTIPRKDLATQVQSRLGVSQKWAYKVVNRAIDAGLVVQVNEEGEPDDSGTHVALPQD